MKYGKRKKATKEANYRKYSKCKKAPGGGGGVNRRNTISVKEPSVVLRGKKTEMANVDPPLKRGYKHIVTLHHACPRPLRKLLVPIHS